MFYVKVLNIYCMYILIIVKLKINFILIIICIFFYCIELIYK